KIINNTSIGSVDNNTFGPFVGIAVNGSGIENVSYNEISGNSVTGPTGDLIAISGGNIFNNNLIFSNGAPYGVTGIASATNTIHLFKNKIYDLYGGLVQGISISSDTAYISNNYIGKLNAINGSITGMNLAVSVLNLFYNTIYLSNGSIAQPGFESFDIYINYGNFFKPTSAILQNNIIANTSVDNGNTVAFAMGDSEYPVDPSYFSSSNNNLYYAGIPSSSNLIFLNYYDNGFYHGTTSNETLGQFKARVAPRENVSISAMPDFLDTTGLSPQYLHINPATPTDIESGGFDVSEYKTDYDGDIRQDSSGYSGTGTHPDIGADEFEGTRISAPLPLTLISFKASHSGLHN
ncbi:MAG: hypothetical protein ACRDE5_17620, partial [Ginsengibacter sp.]